MMETSIAGGKIKTNNNNNKIKFKHPSIYKLLGKKIAGVDLADLNIRDLRDLEWEITMKFATTLT